MKIDYNLIKILIRKIRILERELDFQLKSETICCGVTLPQCHIILELAEKRESSIKELSETFGLDKSTLSRTIDSMVESGFINRNTKKEDRRFLNLSLSKKGMEKADYINSQCNIYFAQVLKDIPGEKQNMIIDSISLLGDIMSNIRGCCSADNSKC